MDETKGRLTLKGVFAAITVSCIIAVVWTGPLESQFSPVPAAVFTAVAASFVGGLLFGSSLAGPAIAAVAYAVERIIWLSTFTSIPTWLATELVVVEELFPAILVFGLPMLLPSYLGVQLRRLWAA